MNEQNIILRALDRAASALTGSPQNAARPAQPKAPEVQWPGEEAQPSETYQGATNTGSLPATPPEPLSKEARAELQPKIKARVPTPADALAGVSYASPAQIAAYDERLAQAGYVPPVQALARLKEMDVPWIRLSDAIEACSRSQNAAQIAHMEDLARRTAAGDATVHEEDAWSSLDWTEDARLKMGAFKNERKKFEDQAWSIAEPASQAKADFVDDVADSFELEERDRWAQMATPYRCPAWLLTMRKYAATLRDGSRRTAGLPSAMLADL